MVRQSKEAPESEQVMKGLGNLAIAVSAGQEGQAVTARIAGGLVDMKLPVSPAAVPVRKALQSMAKAINIALQSVFLETQLEPAYRAARVVKGEIIIYHRDYIGLGDGMVAVLGRAARSMRLTLRGPDPASPEGKAWIRDNGGGSIRGLCDLMGRKLDLIQEYEDMVPGFVEQMLDRLEAAAMVVGWDRNEWEIDTRLVGLDIVMRPRTRAARARRATAEATRARRKK